MSLHVTSVKAIERSKSPPSVNHQHSREWSSDDFSIEEVLPDDMGYDADVEIRPDRYEEVDSESEGTGTPNVHWQTIDEELAARMKRLGKEQLTPLRRGSGRGRKRKSIEMNGDDTLFAVPLSPDLEVQEVVDGSHLPSPAKRRRRRSRRPPYAGQSTLRSCSETRRPRSSQRHFEDGSAAWDASTASSPGQTVPSRDDGDEMMDMT